MAGGRKEPSGVLRHEIVEDSPADPAESREDLFGWNRPGAGNVRVRAVPPAPAPPVHARPVASERVLLWISVGVWAVSVLAFVGQARGFLVASGIACLILSAWAAQRRLERMVHCALVLAPALAAFAYREPFLLLLGALPLFALLRVENPRQPFVPRRGRRAVLMGVLVYLALAPVVDASILSARPMPRVEAPEGMVVEGTERRLAGGGRLQEWFPSVGGSSANVSLVVISQPGSGLRDDLVREFGVGSAWFFFWSRGTSSSERDLGGGWTRIDVTAEYSSVVGWYARTEIFLLHEVEDTHRPMLTPPFVREERTLAGYRLVGDVPEETLRRLIEYARVEGSRMVPPPGAYADHELGYKGVPLPPWLAVMAAFVALVLRRPARPRGSGAS